jgi:hypothetical protein
MNENPLSQNAQDWIEAIEISPLDWADGMLESMLNHDGVCGEDREVILRRYKSLLDHIV